MLKLLLSSDVTVCSTLSLFLTVTVEPAFTGAVTLNCKFCIVIAAEVLLPPLLLHAARSDTARMAATTSVSAVRRERVRGRGSQGMSLDTETARVAFTGVHAAARARVPRSRCAESRSSRP